MTLHSGFRTYHLAVEFHRACTRVRCPGYLRNQLLRASSSIALNLSEGSAKPVGRDRARFYTIAMGSFRESQTALELIGLSQESDAFKIADKLGAHLYRLLHPERGTLIRVANVGKYPTLAIRDTFEAHGTAAHNDAGLHHRESFRSLVRACGRIRMSSSRPAFTTGSRRQQQQQ